MKQTPEIGGRITDQPTPPDEDQVRTWMGRSAFIHWTKLREWISASYPEVFSPDWLYGGKSRGWSMRYTKGKALCTLIPGYRSFSVLIVLGGAEREKFEGRRYSWSPQLVRNYDETRTFHDGKWLTVPILSSDDRREVADLIEMKRPALAASKAV